MFNAAQTLSLLIWPFSRRGFRAFNRWGANTWWGWCDRLAEGPYGIRVEMSGDDLPVGENAVVVVNHQQMTDITVLFRLARRQGKVPAWIVTFVEGTRIKPSKLARSQEYAAENGLPVLKHLLTPRTKGFVATVQALRGHATAVYDMTIGYVGGVPTLMQWAKGYVRVVHVHARRYPLESLPSTDAELTAWLHARFKEKDRLLDDYYRDDYFAPAFVSDNAGNKMLRY